MSDDGWNIGESLESLLTAYEKIHNEISKSPVEKEVKESEKEVKESEKEKDDNRIRIVTDFEEEGAPVLFLPPDEDDEDDLQRKPVYFKPSLQVQRNQFVKNTLKDFVHNKRFQLKKLAVLGCGESSLERFLCHELGHIGIERVISVDIEEECLARGIRLLRQQIRQNSDVIRGSNNFPVLFEHCLGDILKYDQRLVGTDCVCSTEVIEHISVEDAEKFVRLVLDQIKPKLFIISTPNHEYNKAFGMEEGTFRHDDHKYEFTRQQFIKWINEILVTSGSEYKCDLHYVGNLAGYKDLQGATQFAVLSREGEVAKEPHGLNKPFEKVAHTVACGGLNSVLLKRGRSALKEWLKNNKLNQSNLKKTEYAEFWEIPLSEIFKLMDVSPLVIANAARDNMLEMLKTLARGRLFTHKAGPQADDSKQLLIVPHDCKIDLLIEIL